MPERRLESRENRENTRTERAPVTGRREDMHKRTLQNEQREHQRVGTGEYKENFSSVLPLFCSPSLAFFLFTALLGVLLLCSKMSPLKKRKRGGAKERERRLAV